MAVKKNEAIIAELLKQFKDLKGDFLEPIRSRDELVNNDVINFNDIGADPNVLINNAVYPIAVNSRTDDKVPVALYRLDTENTKITDDELHALPYDKKSSVMQSHRDALKRATLKLGAWSLAPQADSANSPIVLTTGATVGKRKRLTPTDLITFRERLDPLEIDPDTMYLPLSSAHVNDLLLVDQSFRDRYYNTETGKVIKNIFGFNIFESRHTPKYNGTNNTKKAYGAASAISDMNCSPFYSTLNAMKAQGSVSMYNRPAELDPENRQTVIGFSMYYIVSPVSAKGTGAIIDTYVP